MKYGFPKKMINSLVCQKDGGKLDIISEIDSNEYTIRKGTLACEQCNSNYFIKKGIVNLLDNQNRLDNLLEQEIKSRDVEAFQYNRKLQTRYEKEVSSTLKCLGNFNNKYIIEYGSGTGRLTKEIFKVAKQVLAIDFSYESLVWASENIEFNNVGLVLADITQLRTAKNYFDIALSTQCFEHIPNNKLKNFHLKSVYDTIKVGGYFVSSVYHHDIRRRLKKLSQEGIHRSGIYYYYYSLKELSDIYVKFFSIVSSCFIDITLPLEARFSFSPKLSGKISRICENIPVLNELGHLILLKCKKK